jgi:hypothetical protein
MLGSPWYIPLFRLIEPENRIDILKFGSLGTGTKLGTEFFGSGYFSFDLVILVLD